MSATSSDVCESVELLRFDRQGLFDRVTGSQVFDLEKNRRVGGVCRRNETRTQPKNSVAAGFLIVNQLEMVRLRLTIEHGFEHRTELLVPRAAAEVVDPLADTLLGRQPKHRIEAFVRCPNSEFGVEDEECFARGARTSHEAVDQGKVWNPTLVGRFGAGSRIGPKKSGPPCGVGRFQKRCRFYAGSSTYESGGVGMGSDML